MTATESALALALAACALGLVAVAVTVYLLVQLRSLRRGQRLLLGTDQQDMVEYAVGLLARVERVEARADGVDRRVDGLGGRVDACLRRRALLRYDALEGSGGKQSASIALLDESGSGLVLTAIQDREYARIYVKQVSDGAGDVELSPEERLVVDRAVAT